MAEESNNFWALERANRRRAAMLVAGEVLVFAALGLGFDLRRPLSKKLKLPLISKSH
jgi:hypothetical protein